MNPMQANPMGLSGLSQGLSQGHPFQQLQQWNQFSQFNQFNQLNQLAQSAAAFAPILSLYNLGQLMTNPLAANQINVAAAQAQTQAAAPLLTPQTPAAAQSVHVPTPGLERQLQGIGSNTESEVKKEVFDKKYKKKPPQKVKKVSLWL